MTLRERIADWISGGALTRARIAEKAWRSEAYDCMVKTTFAEAQARDQSRRAYIRQEQLNRIAACETPSSNGTVRRMARIAREALE